ncbi:MULTISPECIES: Fic family protein [unclassified Helicobacter]|uniref:Fic family protein n=1 Tax=unclassified Helicobacter TaxID=2593540 RepID=UPI001F280A99|nr:MULTISPECIES: Fic family protein [unclassified Helicobacter]
MFQALKNEEYLKDLTIRMAHHSTAIEGNTLTQNQTASIILENFIPNQTSEREFFEVRNYRFVIPKVLELYEQNLRDKKSIDIHQIKELHSVLMDNLIDNKGQFKTIPNLIVGADFETSKPYLVPTHLQEMLNNLDYQIKQSKSDDEKLEAILQSHFHFEKIHPFSDGNGRVGRLLMFYFCIENEITPFVIQKEQKPLYISILRENNLSEFKKLAKTQQEIELGRLDIFLNQHKQEKKKYCFKQDNQCKTRSRGR